MRIPESIGGFPISRIALAGFVVLVFGAAVIFATSGGDEAKTPASNRSTAGAGLDVAPTRLATVPAATATPAAAANRANCTAIQGTDYRSPEERQWFLANCSGSVAASRSSGGPAPISGPAPAPSAGQAPLGDRLVIPAGGVNTDVWRATVPASGAMPDPIGYFNVVWYDFSNLPGHGGTPASGNVVLSGHVDCARCHNGASGTAVFWHIRGLKTGDTAQDVAANGQVQNYVVTSSLSYSPDANWSAIVASGAADMTLITCTGSFQGGEYSLRHVVAFRKT